jgi:hypothetical protein
MQPDFTLITNKMMDRLNTATKEQKLTAIRTFFEVAESKKYDSLPKEIRDSPDEFCKEICLEAINRDFVSYVSKGDTGDVGRLVYSSLKD